MNNETKERIYFGMMTVLMIMANVLLRQTTQEKLKQIDPYVLPVTLFVFIGLFFIRRHMLRQKFSKYLAKYPIRPYHYKLNGTVKAVHAGVFFATELFGILVIAMSIHIMGFGIGNEIFEKIHLWESFAGFAIFPFLGQLMPLLLRWDEQHHKESQEKAGLYYESYY